MKKFISILMVLLILLQSFSKTWVVVSFKINQDYIAKVLCANRFKPEMHCSGKCVLNQRLKAEEQKEKSDLPQILKKQNETVYCFEPFSPLMIAENAWPDRLAKSNFQQTHFISPFLKGIFHPPNFFKPQFFG